MQSAHFFFFSQHNSLHNNSSCLCDQYFSLSVSLYHRHATFQSLVTLCCAISSELKHSLLDKGEKEAHRTQKDKKLGRFWIPDSDNINKACPQGYIK